MAVHRVRCRLRFTGVSGYAAWAKANLAVRYGQAMHLNEGLANEERKHNDYTIEGAHHIYECDLPLMNEAHAIDAYHTLAAVMIEPWVVPGDSFVEHHICRHEESPVAPCEIVNRVEL